MIRLLCCVALCALSWGVPVLGWAQSVTRPYYTVKQQGAGKPGYIRTCSTTTSVLIESDGDRRQWTARLAPGESGPVYLCPDVVYGGISGAPTPTPGPCNTPGPTPPGAAGSIVLDTILPAFTEGDAAKVRVRCRKASGSASLMITESR